MSLDWTVTEIKNYAKVTTAPYLRDGMKQWHIATQALVWLSIHCGYNRITEKNVEEVAQRIALWETYIGPIMVGDSGGLPVSMQDVRDHVGLGTNASVLTKREFWVKMRRIMETEARLSKDSIDTQVRRNAYKRRADHIVPLVEQYEGVSGDIDVRDQLWHWFETTDRIDLDDADIAAQLAQTIVHP